MYPAAFVLTSVAHRGPRREIGHADIGRSAAEIGAAKEVLGKGFRGTGLGGVLVAMLGFLGYAAVLPF